MSGERLLFSAREIYNCTIMPRDQQGNPWSSIDGCCMDGPYKGHVLERIPTYQMTWGKWKQLHPDTQVILPPAPGSYNHQDLRHGHGADQYPGKNGILDHFPGTLQPPGVLDHSIPENTLTLCLHMKGDLVAYPLDEVKKAGCVVNQELAGEPVVIFAQPEDGWTLAAYSRRFGKQAFTFAREGELFKDDLTGSLWDIEGKCVKGTLAMGESIRLWPLDFIQTEWHNWAPYHPNSRLWRCEKPATVEARDSELQAVFTALAEGGHPVEVEAPLISVHRPFGAEVGYVVQIDGGRFFAYRFRSMAEAADHTWINHHSVQAGHIVLENYPPDQWTNYQQFRRKPDREVSWSKLLADEGFVRTAQSAISNVPKAQIPSFKNFLGQIDQAGYPVTHVEWQNEGQLYPGCEGGLFCRIRRERFLVYRYPDEASADAFVETLPAAISCGPWVLRSDPATQYLAKETITQPVNQVDWSRLLEDDAFIAAVQKAAGQG